jgi:hypothetical protein
MPIQLNPIAVALLKKKGASTKDAMLFSSVLPAAGVTGKLTAGNVIVADKLTDKLVIKGTPINPQATKLNLVPSGMSTGGEVRRLPSFMSRLGRLPRPVAPSVTLPKGRFVQCVEGANLKVDLSEDPIKISGTGPITVDFKSPVEGRGMVFAWDFGDEALSASSSPNPQERTYENEGDFSVTLKITDASGKLTELQVAEVEVTAPG